MKITVLFQCVSHYEFLVGVSIGRYVKKNRLLILEFVCACVCASMCVWVYFSLCDDFTNTSHSK